MKIKVKKIYHFLEAIKRFFDFNRDTRLKARYIQSYFYRQNVHATSVHFYLTVLGLLPGTYMSLLPVGYVS